jgi:ribosomal 30S subunit maturation factor RimM
VSDQPLDDDAERLKEIFVVIDGLQVPFPVEELELLTDTSAHVQLEFVDNQDEALVLVGCQVYAATAHNIQEIEAGWEQWTGFAVRDTKFGKIGVIQKIEDYNGNIVMQVMDGRKETLISLYPELITRMDQNAKILQITAPEGYF